MPLRGNVSTVDDIKLSGNQLYALGDNYAHSYDSRYIGPVGMDRIIGKVVAIEHETKPKIKPGRGK
jgi:type IV secretory pathway protease TraF